MCLMALSVACRFLQCRPHSTDLIHVSYAFVENKTIEILYSGHSNNDVHAPGSLGTVC